MKNYFSRHVLKRIAVYKYNDFALEKPEIKISRKKIETYPLNTDLKIKTTELLDFHDNLSCNAQGFRFSDRLLELANHVHGDKVRRYSKHEVKIRKFSGMKKIRTWKALQRIIAIPQERTNRLKWQRKRPQLSPGEMVLAWYGPIVDGAVLKLALNKQRGTLLVWYNHRSKQFKSRGVFLFRRLGLGEKPEWRWV